jgi:hypothetical protein
MPSTVFANQRGVAHKSSHQGATIAAFPDVCKTPTPGGPVPIPYPNLAGSPQQDTAVSKSSTMPNASFSMSSGDEAGTLKGVVASKQTRTLQLRSQLHSLHAQMAAMPGGNPTRWHKLLDDYVLVTAELYKTLTD